MNTIALKKLNEELKSLTPKIQKIYDPVDQITLISGFIKRILESQEVDEVVLASPFGPDFDWDEYGGTNYDDETMADCIKAYQTHNPDFEWLEPYWLDCLTVFDHLNRTTIVRLGIVDGEVKFTKQGLLQPEVDDIPGMPDPRYPATLSSESEWLKLTNIPRPSKWYVIARALLQKTEIWQYNATYPELRKHIVG